MQQVRVRRKVSASNKVAEEIKSRIASGKYPPHSYLPSERELAEELATGRNTVSAALTLLTRERFVLKTRGRGTRVLPHQSRLAKETVGIVLSSLSSFKTPREPAQVLTGIQDTFLRFGYRYELVPTPERSGSVDELASGYGALLFAEARGHEDMILELERRRIPVVVANLEIDLEVSATWVNHQKPSHEAVRILTGFGHRRIAFLGQRPDYLFYGKAREGYLAGLAQRGIAPDDSLIAVCAETDPLSAYLATKTLLDRSQPPTALVAARDILAQGACQAITEAGLVVGRDISVIGFDDVTWPQEEPFLTTFREPCREMAATAAEMLVERIVNGWRPPEKREFEATLVLRRSAGLPPA